MQKYRQDARRTFHISTYSGLFGIKIAVYNPIIEGIDLSKFEPCIKETQEKLELGDFYFSPWCSIGFGSPIRYEGTYRVWRIYYLEYPLHTKNCELCPYCMGNHKIRCLYCDGKGFVSNQNSTALRAASASLSIFLRMISSSKRLPHTKKVQLLQLGTTTDTDLPFEPFAMSGRISAKLQQLLRRNDLDLHNQLTQQMQLVYSWMLGKEEYLSTYFQVNHNPDCGAIHLSCPGNACGIDPSEYVRTTEDTGYGFQSHNMTNPAQQLTIISGLAELCRIADMASM